MQERQCLLLNDKRNDRTLNHSSSFFLQDTWSRFIRTPSRVTVGSRPHISLRHPRYRCVTYIPTTTDILGRQEAARVARRRTGTIHRVHTENENDDCLRKGIVVLHIHPKYCRRKGALNIGHHAPDMIKSFEIISNLLPTQALTLCEKVKYRCTLFLVLQLP